MAYVTNLDTWLFAFPTPTLIFHEHPHVFSLMGAGGVALSSEGSGGAEGRPPERSGLLAGF